MQSSIRLSSIISTFSPGSIIDLVDLSVIGLGMDTWIDLYNGQFSDEMKIEEPRLKRSLAKQFPNLEYFVQLSPSVNPRTGEKMARQYPVRVFPEMMFCQKCRRLDFFSNLRLDNEEPWKTPYRCRFCAEEYNTITDAPKLISSRFIRACENGHIDDFPYSSYVHFPDLSCGNIKLKLEVKGQTSGLSDLEIICQCGKKRSMEDAFDEKFNRGISCTRRLPELGIIEKECPPDKFENPIFPRTVLRGATNVHFPRIKSALSLPLETFSVLNNPWIPKLRRMLERIDAIEVTKENISRIKGGWEFSEPPGVDLPSDEDLFSYKITESSTNLDEDLSIREFKVLTSGREFKFTEKGNTFYTENYSIIPDSLADHMFERIVLIPKLNEIRTMIAYNRLEYVGDMKTQLVTKDLESVNINYITKHPRTIKYLPGIKFNGEGVFFQLNPDLLNHWLSHKVDQDDDEGTNNSSFFNHRTSLLDRPEQSNITPEELLTHTLSHAVILAFSEISGYSTSSIRERLYVNIKLDGQFNETPGFLIYTATPDSEGSLGGLIKVFRSGKINEILERMTDNMRWCSSDPVCIETTCTKESTFRNHAACHACLLLPETSCVVGNEILDRTTLVGTIGDRGRQRGVLLL